MTIRWNGSIKVRGAAGRTMRLGAPGNEANTDLHAPGAGYEVHELLSDQPHASDGGH